MEREEESQQASSSDAGSTGLSFPGVLEKVIVRFKAAGNAPILKQNKFKVSSLERFQTIIDFLRRQLQYSEQEPLFLYVDSAFQPSPDTSIANLHNCFKMENMLVIHYCTTAAWG